MLSETLLKKIGTFLLLLVGFNIFMAKVPVNIAGSLLFITSMVYLVRFGNRSLWLDNRYVIVLLAPFFIGFVFSFFSMAGINGPWDFVLRFRFLLLVLPFVLFVRDKKTIETLFILMNIGAFLDISYCMIHAGFTDMFQEFWGFHKFARNAAILFSLCLFDLTFLLVHLKSGRWKQKKVICGAYFFNTVLMLVSVFLLGERGAWIGLYIGVVILLILYEKKLLILLIAATILSPLYLPDAGIDRIRSIVDVNHISNQIRLKLYKTGFDFIVEENCWVRGTGGKNVKDPLTDFFENKSAEYRGKYYQNYISYYNSFHNSFLQMAVEGGVLFLVSYLMSYCYLLVQMFKRRNPPDPDEQIYLISAIALTVGFFVSQFFHEELFRYGGLVFAITFYCGCFVANRVPEKGYAQDNG